MSRRPLDTSPTLLVFTLGPEADCARRPVLPRRLREVERDVRAASTARALAAGRACGCDLEIASRDVPVSPDVRHVEQLGQGFGDRFASTLAASWRRNPDGPVVVVGGDIPDLSRRHVERALTAVERDPEAVVIGPSPDGGFYLLATGRPLGAALDEVRWCRRSTCADLVAAARRVGRPVVLLEPLADLDRPRDLATLLDGDWIRHASHLARRLRAALREISRPRELPAMRPAVVRLRPSQPRRGPPA